MELYGDAREFSFLLPSTVLRNIWSFTHRRTEMDFSFDDCISPIYKSTNIVKVHIEEKYFYDGMDPLWNRIYVP